MLELKDFSGGEETFRGLPNLQPTWPPKISNSLRLTVDRFLSGSRRKFEVFHRDSYLESMGYELRR